MVDNTSLLDYCCHDDSELVSHSNNSTGTEEPSSANRNASASVKRDNDSGLSVTLVMVTSYLVICVVGLVGNTLVVSVIARFAKMKTVTNVYILNLSIADGLFLIGLPMIATTSILRHWAFGSLLCKVYYVLTSINMFTGTFTLTLMSADRFFAVWYPIKSLRYRATKFAAIEVALTWVVSFALMIPIVLYAKQVPKSAPPGLPGHNPGPLAPSQVRYSCQVHWPAEHPMTAIRIYFVYNLLVGFVIPVALIFIFYLLLVLRLRSKRLNLRPGGAGADKKPRRGRRSVTTLVTVIITVFIVCWLPYWAFQSHIIFVGGPLPPWSVNLFQFFTVLTYSNSAINPLLYAFTNDTFKKAFVAACRCSRLTSDSDGRSETVSGGGGVGGCCRPKKGVAVAMDGPSRRRQMKTKQATVLYDFSGSVQVDNEPDRLEVEETVRGGNDAVDVSGENIVLRSESGGNANAKASEETIALYNETGSQMVDAV